MAEIYTDEGLDDIINVYYRGTQAARSTLYLGYFTSQTATTVPARTATGGATPTGWTEATYTGYARQAIAAADWGAPATNGSGRRTTATQKSPPANGSATPQTINGFFVATASAAGAGDRVLFFANFDDGVAVTLQQNDQVRTTPSAQHDG